MFVYLLKMSDCSYKWTYQGSSTFLPMVRQVAWSHDEKQAYVLGVDQSFSPVVEYLIVFRQPTSRYFGGKPVIFKTALDSTAYSGFVANLIQIYDIQVAN